MIELWPIELGDGVMARPPVTIVRDQETLPGQETRNLLQSEVSQFHSPYIDPPLVYSFYIVTPAS
jgi:hypothetical protein